jgi:hypothetical protein
MWDRAEVLGSRPILFGDQQTATLTVASLNQESHNNHYGIET